MSSERLPERVTCEQRLDVGKRFARHPRESTPGRPQEGRPGVLEELAWQEQHEQGERNDVLSGAHEVEAPHCNKGETQSSNRQGRNGG